jgi:hypothetical protein
VAFIVNVEIRRKVYKILNLRDLCLCRWQGRVSKMKVYSLVQLMTDDSFYILNYILGIFLSRKRDFSSDGLSCLYRRDVTFMSETLR